MIRELAVIFEETPRWHLFLSAVACGVWYAQTLSLLIEKMIP